MSRWNPLNCGDGYRLWGGCIIAWRRFVPHPNLWFVDGEVVVLEL